MDLIEDLVFQTSESESAKMDLRPYSSRPPTTSLLTSINFVVVTPMGHGYQSDSGSSSRQQFWRTSVSSAWPQNTSRCTASQCQLSPADVSGLLTPVD